MSTESNISNAKIESAVVPARDGYDWVRLSIRLFRMQWLRYSALTALFILISQVAAALTGGLLAFFLKPILSVGFLAAAWHHERGETPEVKHLFAGFRSNVGALLPLGLTYLLGLLAATTLGVYASGLDLRVLMEAQSSGDMKNVESGALLNFMLFTTIGMLPVNAALWFAPALIVFSDAGFLRALKESFAAWTKNVLAVTVYALALGAFMIAVMLIVAPIMIIGGAAIRAPIAMIALVPIFAILMISDYVAYRRVFHRTERLAVNEPSKSDTPNA